MHDNQTNERRYALNNMAEQFTEDDFDVPSDEDFVEDEAEQAIPQPQRTQAPAPRPMAPKQGMRPPARKAPAQAPTQMQQQAPQQAPVATPPAAEAQARYVPYEMPKRIGVLDRTSGKPIIEDEDMLRVVMAQLADIKNDIEEIKSYYR